MNLLKGDYFRLTVIWKKPSILSTGQIQVSQKTPQYPYCSVFLPLDQQCHWPVYQLTSSGVGGLVGLDLPMRRRDPYPKDFYKLPIPSYSRDGLWQPSQYQCLPKDSKQQKKSLGFPVPSSQCWRDAMRCLMSGKWSLNLVGRPTCHFLSLTVTTFPWTTTSAT